MAHFSSSLGWSYYTLTYPVQNCRLVMCFVVLLGAKLPSDVYLEVLSSKNITHILTHLARLMRVFEQVGLYR